MNVVAKTLFWLGISWAIISFFILAAGQYLPFEFSNENTGRAFYGFVGCTFPIAVVLTLVRPVIGRVHKAIAVFIALVSVPILALYALGSGMCGYVTDNVLFINKSDSSLKIVERHYDCGAYDSQMPEYVFFEMKPLTNQILFSKKIDTLLIDKNIWLRNTK